MSVCKCGKQIVWGRTADGKNVPLDPKAPVYAIMKIHPGAPADICRTSLSMVSHFITCPNANDFSASRKKPEETPAPAPAA